MRQRKDDDGMIALFNFYGDGGKIRNYSSIKIREILDTERRDAFPEKRSAGEILSVGLIRLDIVSSAWSQHKC